VEVLPQEALQAAELPTAHLIAAEALQAALHTAVDQATHLTVEALPARHTVEAHQAVHHTAEALLTAADLAHLTAVAQVALHIAVVQVVHLTAVVEEAVAEVVAND
jgi:hypothetical protein